MVFSRKRFISCFLLLVILAISFPLYSHAADEPKGTCTTYQKGEKVQYTNVSKGECRGDWVPNANGETGPVVGSPVKEADGCLLPFGKCALASVANAILSFFAFVLGLSALLLDKILTYTVVELRSHLDGANGISAISEAWSALRDLINLSFIFILLFAAIRTILGLESPGKIIKNIILAALFINFSMFFARVMIDASNSFTLFFYDRLTNTAALPAGSSSAFGLGTPQSTGLVNGYVGPLKIQTLYSQAKANANLDTLPSYSSIFVVGILGSFMLGLVAFVLLTVSFMFLIRYAGLILLLIFSPLGFISADLPMIGDYNKQWWNMFKSQLLFPPIFMVLTWITLKVINSNGFIGASCTTCDLRSALGAGGAVPNSDGISLIINFLIVMTLIVMSLLISLQTAQEGSGALGSFYKKTTKWAGGAMFGTAGFLGRKTIGKAGYALSQNETLKNFAAESRVGRLALLGANAAQKGSFDVRGSTLGGAFKDTTGLDAGKAGGTGGRAKEMEDSRKKLEERAKLLEVSAPKKDEVKAKLADIAAEKKPIEENIKKLEDQKKTIENSDEYKNEKTENTKLTKDLETLDADIKAKTREYENSPTTGDLSKRFAIKAELDGLVSKKSETEIKKRTSDGVLSDFGADRIAADLKKLKQQKEDIEKAGNESELKIIKDQQDKTEKARKRAYAKSIKETPSTAQGFIGKLTSVVNLGVEGLASRALAAPFTVGRIVSVKSQIKERTIELESATGEDRDKINQELKSLKEELDGMEAVGLNTANKEAGDKIRAGLAEKSKDQKLAETVKQFMEGDKPDDKKPDDSSVGATPPAVGGTTPPSTP